MSLNSNILTQSWVFISEKKILQTGRHFIHIGQVLVGVCALVQASFGCCILLLLVPKMVWTLCYLHWLCFSSHQLEQIHS